MSLILGSNPSGGGGNNSTSLPIYNSITELISYDTTSTVKNLSQIYIVNWTKDVVLASYTMTGTYGIIVYNTSTNTKIFSNTYGSVLCPTKISDTEVLCSYAANNARKAILFTLSDDGTTVSVSSAYTIPLMYLTYTTFYGPSAYPVANNRLYGYDSNTKTLAYISLDSIRNHNFSATSVQGNVDLSSTIRASLGNSYVCRIYSPTGTTGGAPRIYFTTRSTPSSVKQYYFYGTQNKVIVGGVPIPVDSSTFGVLGIRPATITSDTSNHEVFALYYTLVTPDGILSQWKSPAIHSMGSTSNTSIVPIDGGWAMAVTAEKEVLLCLYRNNDFCVSEIIDSNLYTARTINGPVSIHYDNDRLTVAYGVTVSSEICLKCVRFTL